MRFVATNCLREGMKLGKSILGNKNERLLSAGCILKDSYIRRIKELGYNGIYIDDNLSKDIEIVETISTSLRNETANTIKGTFMNAESSSDGKVPLKEQEDINKLIGNMINEILENKNFMVNMVDLKTFDNYTYFHSVNVTVLSVVIGVGLGLNEQDLFKLGLGALLHDIGKIFIPKEILNKPGKLTDEEYEIMKTHAYKGFEYLKNHFDIPITSYVAALQHHERYDGTGYPYQYKGDNISLFGRIMAVADVYDALTSDRPYRKGLLPSEAVEYIMAGGGTLFDPKMVRVFVDKVAPYPVGTFVRLSDKREGIVAENFQRFGMRPKVKIVIENGEEIEPYVINMKDDKNTRHVTITEVLQK